MGIRIELGEGESIADALKRFRRLINAEGGFPCAHYRWHKPRRDIYQKPSIYRRRRHWRDAVARQGRVGSNPDPDLNWIEDLFLRPRTAWSSPDRGKRKSPADRRTRKP